MTRTQARRRAVRWLAAFAVASVAVMLAPVFDTTAHAANAKGKPITRAEVIARAHNWYRRNIQYSQGGTASDPDGTHTYRRDCSGFVSMAWHLSASGMSAATTTTLPDYANRISKSSLQPGDILDYPGHHTVLFHKWANAEHTKFVYFSESNHVTDMNHSTASLSSYSAYHAYRYSKIMNNEVAGTLGTSAAGTTCSNNPYEEIHLPDMRNVQVRVQNCVRNDSGTLRGWMVLSWKPNDDGTDDSSTIGHDKFIGFGAHIQLQTNDNTRIEGHCRLEDSINAADSGSRSCAVSDDAADPAGFTADAWLDWNKHGDSHGYIGAHYLKASPAL